MAIKELVKTFALFLGYEMPDSGGTSGTILDGYDDAIGDINDGFETTNDELDKAKQKTKEWKNFLASFDVAQVIPDQSTDDTSGSGSGSSGTGGMTVDPRLLDALNKYKYLFDDIHMKAVDIRDELLKWKDTLFDIIKENIFEPIQTSWNKYGPSILNNAKKSFENIGYIASGVFDVVGEKWKPFFQQASDLFFSLLDTVTLVSSTVTKLLKVIWDNGGDVLLEGVFDLITAFLKLAKSVNDNFVKPFIKAINGTLVTIIGVAVGKILGVIGSLLAGLGKIISWIAKCEPLVTVLGSAFVTMFAAIKIIKFVDMFSTIQKHLGTFNAFNYILLENSKLYSKVATSVSSFKSSIKGTIDIAKNLNRFIGNTQVWKNLCAHLGLSSTAFTGVAAAEGATATSTGILGTALNFLAANPIVAIIAAVTAVITVTVLLAKNWDTISAFLKSCWEGIKNVAGTVWSGIKDVINVVSNFISSLLVDLWNSLSVENREWLMNIYNSVSSVFNDIKNFFSTVWEGISFIFTTVLNTIDSLFSNKFEGMRNLFISIWESISSFTSSIWNTITSIFSAFLQILSINFSTTFDGMFKNCKIVWEGIKGVLDGIITFVRGVFTGNWSTAWTGVKKIFSSIWNSLSVIVGNVWNNILSLFSNGGRIFSGVVEGIARVFKNIVNSMISGINNVVSYPFNRINEMLNDIKNIDLPVIGKPFYGLWGYNPVWVPRIPYFANGGFPDVGQMFIAREAGPEFVGSLGGRSAVANNYQIENGIYRAVKAAMSSSNSGGDLHITILNKDGTKTEKIIKDYKKNQIFNGGKGGIPV